MEEQKLTVNQFRIVQLSKNVFIIEKYEESVSEIETFKFLCWKSKMASLSFKYVAVKDIRGFDTLKFKTLKEAKDYINELIKYPEYFYFKSEEDLG